PAGATLTAQVRYEIEQEWDYAYVILSTDGGATWEHVATNLSTSDNPNGQNFGNGITGSSGGNWVELTADLAAYGGKTVLLGVRRHEPLPQRYTQRPDLRQRGPRQQRGQLGRVARRSVGLRGAAGSPGLPLLDRRRGDRAGDHGGRDRSVRQPGGRRGERRRLDVRPAGWLQSDQRHRGQQLLQRLYRGVPPVPCLRSQPADGAVQLRLP